MRKSNSIISKSGRLRVSGPQARKVVRNYARSTLIRLARLGVAQVVIDQLAKKIPQVVRRLDGLNHKRGVVLAIPIIPGYYVPLESQVKCLSRGSMTDDVRDGLFNLEQGKEAPYWITNIEFAENGSFDHGVNRAYLGDAEIIALARHTKFKRSVGAGDAVYPNGKLLCARRQEGRPHLFFADEDDVGSFPTCDTKII